MCIQSSVIKIFWNSGWSPHSFSYLLWWSNGGDIELSHMSWYHWPTTTEFGGIQLFGHPTRPSPRPSSQGWPLSLWYQSVSAISHMLFSETLLGIFCLFLLKCWQDGCCRVSEGFKFTECGDWVSSWPQSRGARGLVARGWGRGCDWSTDVTHLEKGWRWMVIGQNAAGTFEKKSFMIFCR